MTQQAPRLKTAEDAGTALGLYLGARIAEDKVFRANAQEAMHAVLQAAGLCKCDSGDGAVKGLATDAPLRERVLELLAYHSNFVPADLLRKALERDDEEELDPGVEREARQAAAEVLQDSINAMADRIEAAAAGQIEPVVVAELEYCGKCGRAKVFGVLNHAPNCPENPHGPARKPTWAQAAAEG